MTDSTKKQISSIDQTNNKELLSKKYSSLKELQIDLTKSLKTQFDGIRKQLTCPKCKARGETNMSNHGCGGGFLQHQTKSIQLKCASCNGCSRPDTVYEASGNGPEKLIYEQTLVKFQTLAAEINKPNAKQPKITSYFNPHIEDEEMDTVAEKLDTPDLSEKVPKPDPVDTTLINTILSLQNEVKSLKKQVAEQKTTIDELQKTVVEVVRTKLDLNNNTTRPTNQNKSKTNEEKKLVSLQQTDQVSDEIAEINKNDWAEVTYASKVKIKKSKKSEQRDMSDKALRKMISRTNAERVEFPKEFAVKHIELNNNTDLVRLVKARNWSAIQNLLRGIIKSYDIQKEVIRFSRIGKRILEIYISSDNIDQVETKVYNAGGHFDDNMKPGEIPPETLAVITDETAEFIAKSIVKRAASQFMKAPTLNFKKTVIQNYAGRFLKSIEKEILNNKEALSPAPKGTRWKLLDTCVFYQEKIKPKHTSEHQQEADKLDSQQITDINKRKLSELDKKGDDMEIDKQTQQQSAESATKPC